MDTEAERKLFLKYPPHIYLMVKALKAALDEGRAAIKDGTPVFNTQQQVILEKVAMGVGCVATVIHFSAHARLVVRGVKGIAKMVTK